MTKEAEADVLNLMFEVCDCCGEQLASLVLGFDGPRADVSLSLDVAIARALAAELSAWADRVEAGAVGATAGVRLQ